MSVERFHLEAEAARVAYMMREQRIGRSCPGRGRCGRHPEGVRRRICRQDPPWTAMLESAKVSPPMNPSTVYITVVDKDRNVCSFINSIAHSFGSAIVSNKTGVLPAKSWRRFPHSAGSSQLHRAGQASAAHHHSGPCDKNGRAVMPFGVHGRTVSAGRAVSHY